MPSSIMNVKYDAVKRKDETHLYLYLPLSVPRPHLAIYRACQSFIIIQNDCVSMILHFHMIIGFHLSAL